MAAEVVKLTDGTNTVDFLDGTYVFRNIEGLAPPACEVRYAGDKPIHRKWQNREITITFGIKADTAVALDQKKRTIITILENTYLYWQSKGGRGLKAQTQYRKEGGTNISYADVYWGECDWGRVEYQEGAAYAHVLKGAQLTLACETGFHPNTTTNLVNAVTIYNHDDSDSGHDNYVDIAAANIKGDVEAPIKLQVRMQVIANADHLFSFLAARRTRATPASFTHIYEAEDILTQSSWADAVDATCSNGNKVSNSAQASGYLQQVIVLNTHHKGRFKCYARLKTNDIANTKFRIRYAFQAGSAWNYGDWKYLPVADKWQRIDLGDVDWDKFLGGFPDAQATFRLEYSKDATDTAECDYITFMPIDESLAYGDVISKAQLWAVSDTFVMDRTLAHPYQTIDLISAETDPRVQARSELRLKPGLLNRIYFAVESYDGTDVIDEVHGATTDLQMRITIDYLPQYLMPLE